MDNARFAFWFVLLIAVAVLCGIIGMFMTVPADAQERPICMPWSIMEKAAKEKLHEVPTGAIGLINEKSMVSVLASPGGDTWSIVIIGSNDIACVVMSGTNWMPGNIPPAYTHGRSAS